MKFVTLDSERSEFLVGNLDPLCVGEERYQLTGMIEQRLFVVIYTPRHNAMRIISAPKPIEERSNAMKTVHMTIDPATPASERIVLARVDATSEEDIAAHQAADEADAMQDAAKFARRVRMRLGLSQTAFSQRIDVPLDTIRNWE